MIKKQLLLSLLVISSSVLFSQNLIENNQIHDKEMSENYTQNNNSKAGGGWFNHGKEIEYLSNDITSYIGKLHTDSTMVNGYINSNGDTVTYTIWQHSRGQMLDPTSYNFSNTGECEYFLSGAGFILDSIFFPYQYIRPQTTNPDKLIVQFYTTDNGGIAANNPQSWGDLYDIDYDYTTFRGVNAKQTFEYNLTANDSTGPNNNKYLDFALDPVITMPNGGLVAATYTFIPGNTFNSGDTIASHDQPWNVTNPRNSFIGYYWRDSENIDDDSENYNLTVDSDVQYNISTNGWNGNYKPGHIWSVQGSPIMNHQNIWFHLTPIAPTNTSNISATNTKLFPNPANNKVSIVFDNSNDINSIRITDITGRTVYTEIIANNTNAITVTISHYTPGIYFCEINGVTTVETIKFTKIK